MTDVSAMVERAARAMLGTVDPLYVHSMDTLSAVVVDRVTVDFRRLAFAALLAALDLSDVEIGLMVQRYNASNSRSLRPSDLIAVVDIIKAAAQGGTAP